MSWVDSLLRIKAPALRPSKPRAESTGRYVVLRETGERVFVAAASWDFFDRLGDSGILRGVWERLSEIPLTTEQDEAVGRSERIVLDALVAMLSWRRIIKLILVDGNPHREAKFSDDWCRRLTLPDVVEIARTWIEVNELEDHIGRIGSGVKRYVESRIMGVTNAA